MQASDFKKDDRVNYVDLDTCDSGSVTSVNDKYVFARFDKYSAQHCTSQACNPNDLELIRS